MSDAGESDHVALIRISGILCDAGDVPVEPYPEAVRMLVGQRDEAREAVRVAAEALRAIKRNAAGWGARTRASDALAKMPAWAMEEESA